MIWKTPYQEFYSVFFLNHSMPRLGTTRFQPREKSCAKLNHSNGPGLRSAAAPCAYITTTSHNTGVPILQTGSGVGACQGHSPHPRRRHDSQTTLFPVHRWARAPRQRYQKRTLTRPPAPIHRCAAEAPARPARPKGRGVRPASVPRGVPTRRTPAPLPIVPNLTHFCGRGRRPGCGARGELPAAQEAGSVTAGSAKTYSAASPPTLGGRRGRGRLALLARQWRPRRLLRPL
jgi:hypothetical protein